MFKKNKKWMLKIRGIEIMRFGAKFFVSSTGLRHFREMKTSTNDEN